MKTFTDEEKALVIANWGLPEDAKLDTPIDQLCARPRKIKGLERLHIQTVGEFLHWQQKGGPTLDGSPEGFSGRSLSNLLKDTLNLLK